MSLQITTLPTLEPVTLQEAKDHMRVAADFENELIASLIQTARRDAEIWTRRQFFTATLTLKLDDFPDGTAPICLPCPPLQSVTSVAYVDANGDTQTLVAGTDYTVDTASEPGRIILPYNGAWPSPRAQPNAVTIVYVAGWSAINLVPVQIRTYIKMAADWLYRNRGGADVPECFKWILDPMRVGSDAL